MSDRIVIYTAIFGGYDRLREPRGACDGCDFVCFTDDRALRSDRWDIRYVDPAEEGGPLANRRRKMLPHRFFPEYDVSIYMDGNIRVVADPRPLVTEALRHHSIAIPRHPDRDNLYAEAQACVKLGLISQETAVRWLKCYIEKGIPCHGGLFENNLIVRRHRDPTVVRLMEAWWNSYRANGGRDQLSLVYLAYLQGVTIQPLADGPRTSRHYFRIYGHEFRAKRGAWARISVHVYENRQINSLFGCLTVCLKAIHEVWMIVRYGIGRHPS